MLLPHTSTGGLPAYALKKIELLRNSLEIFVIEYEDITGNVLIVQRDQIKNLLDPKHFISLGKIKNKIKDLIFEIKPDYIHLEEIPEYFLPAEIADIIYTPDRKYKIFETSHDSSFTPDTRKRYLPDAFFFVSQYQIDQYKNIDVPKYLAEYPIEYKERPDRDSSLLKLGLDPKKKHVLNVGLFTERKNQGEIFEIARNFNSDVQFHFLGNQAENFKSYWGSIMKNKPDNCFIWGERGDTDNFYSCMDLFLFTSRGNPGNKETMPLVLREAIGWKIPVALYNLDVYLNYFDKYDVRYLENSLDRNVSLVKDIIGNEYKDEITDDITISYDPATKRIHVNITGINNKLIGKKIKVILKDSYNGLTNYALDAEYTPGYSFWFATNASTNDFNGFLVEMLIDDFVIFSKVVAEFGNQIKLIPKVLNKEVLMEYSKFDHSSWWTFYEVFIKREYSGIKKGDVVLDVGSNLGFFSLFALNEGANKIFSIEPSPNNFEHLKNNTKDFPQIVTIQKAITYEDEQVDFFLDVASSVHTLYPNSNQKEGNTVIKIDGLDINSIIKNYGIEKIDFLKIDCEGGEYPFFEKIDEDYLSNNIGFIVGEVHRFAGTKEDYENKIKAKLIRCGFEVKEDRSLNLDEVIIFTANKRPKIKIVHLLNNINDIREKESIESLTTLRNFGLEYQQFINPIYTEIPPSEFCNRPDAVSASPGYYKLGPGHYGCFLAHRQGILEGLNDNVDAILLNECDSIIQFSGKEFTEMVYKAYQFCLDNDLAYVSFGKKIENFPHLKIDDDLYITEKLSEAHCILVPKKNYEYFKNKFLTCPWDVSDLWYNTYIDKRKGIFSRPYALQHPGVSNIDLEYKNGYILHAKNSLLINTSLDDVSVIIQTCDKYEFLWKGMYLSWRNNWCWDLNWPIYFCNEEADPKFNDARIQQIKSPLSNTASGFSDRLIDILNKVKTKYVLYIQDDMWPILPVDKNILINSLYTLKHFDWNCIKLHEKIWYNYKLEKTNHFIGGHRLLKYVHDSEYLLTHNAGLWNREYLLSNILPNEDPWTNEFNGTDRIIKRNEDHKIYHIDYKWYYQPGVSAGGNLISAGHEIIRQLEAKEKYRIDLEL